MLTELVGAYRNPEYIKTQWFSDSNRKANAGCFAHLEVTRLIQKAVAETDPFKKKDLFYKVDALITSLQPGTFLFQKTAIDVMSKRFSLLPPFSLTYDGTYHLRHAVLRQE